MNGKHTEKFRSDNTNIYTIPALTGLWMHIKQVKDTSPAALLGRRTGTINKVEKKLQRNSRRNESEGRIFPSILIIFGTSGMRPIAALKNASAARQKKSPFVRLKNSGAAFVFTRLEADPECYVEVRPRRRQVLEKGSCKPYLTGWDIPVTFR